MKLCKQSSILLLLLAVVSLHASGQCTQKLTDLPDAPELLGFRIGMTKNQVKALVPQTKFGHTDDFGVSKTTINPYFDPTIEKSRYPSVRSISLDFLDERLVSLWIGFDETFKIQTMPEFTKAISESLRLPNAWSTKGRSQQMRCADFQLIATTVARAPSLRLLDLASDDTIGMRRQAKDERDSAAAAATENGAAGNETVTADKNSKTYYPAGCEAAKAVNAQNRVMFKTAEEAQKAGFKIARSCQ